MALILSLNSNLHLEQPLCPRRRRNPIVKSPNSTFYLIHHSNLYFPSDKKLLGGSRIVNSWEKEKESIQTSSQGEDEEVYDLGVKAALSMLRFYKREISPLLPRSCRFVPTCSEYAMIAYKKYGFVKGTVLTTWRICRCNPLGGSGFDPPRWFDETRPTER